MNNEKQMKIMKIMKHIGPEVKREPFYPVVFPKFTAL
jgi:hypothetical protein